MSHLYFRRGEDQSSKTAFSFILGREKDLVYAGVIGMRVSPGIVFPAHISLGMRVHVPAHISLTHLCLQVIVIYVSPGILFPRLCCEVAIAMAELALELA